MKSLVEFTPIEDRLRQLDGEHTKIATMTNLLEVDHAQEYNRSTVIVFGGLAWQNTRYSQTAGLQQFNQNTAAGLVGAIAELFKFNKTNLTIAGTVFPAISRPGRVYTNLNATYYLKFYNDFTWNLSFYGNWDNQPRHNFSGSSYGMSSGLGWTFGNK